METKNSIRKKFLKIRNDISFNERILLSAAIKDRILSMEQIQRADTVLCYAGYGSEVQTMELIETLLFYGKHVYLPRVKGMDMDFFRIMNWKDLKKGYMGIYEPSEKCTDVFAFDNYDKTVMIMPGAVFAPDGSRVGYGKGYYDRYLDRHNITERIAICFQVQITDSIPVDEYDKKALWLVTEKGIYECRKG